MTNKNPVDVYVGSRVRLRRQVLGMSQEKLASQLGLTFQQVQKYEKGTNRIGASRLYDISNILEVPVQFFYEGYLDNPMITKSLAAEEDINNFTHFMRSQESVTLCHYFFKIDNPQIRKQILDIVKSFSESAESFEKEKK